MQSFNRYNKNVNVSLIQDNNTLFVQKFFLWTIVLLCKGTRTSHCRLDRLERLGRICGRNNLSVGFNYFDRWIIRKDGRNIQWAETAVVGFCSMASPSVDTCDVYGCSHIVVKYFITVKQWIIQWNCYYIIIKMVIKN